jgi:tellurite resistance protein TerC
MFNNPWPWVGFHIFILIVLALDLGVFNRKTHTVSLRESLTWTSVWVTLALCFNAGVWPR